MSGVPWASDIEEPGIEALSISDVINRIEHLNEGIALFWSRSEGWAPASAANLLGKSRLDWQVSLSGSLRNWVRDPCHPLTSGDLILAWVNLGSLVEGTIKTLLSVFYNDFAGDIENLKKSGAYDHKKQKIKEPDGLTIDALRKYCELCSLLEQDGLDLVGLVQSRRNAVHAFKNKPIGNDEELQNSIRRYLVLLRHVHGCFPYPDGHRPPTEVGKQPINTKQKPGAAHTAPGFA
jgi:hypothetical protein